ncbi:DUF6148 family protein [Devosia sp. Root635]|uniref:DUF6148 family protein n=1 Tax=Devosia sp. Root635 TaxID=1736575 RepID=UPI0006F21BE6|nr:DUF6148 family protein [Devosia sp. Root635]KRA44689.1 hypothetical protein ASD80_05985 [Devosia sp. Root635]
MPGITVERAQAMLDLWLAAEEALATSQSYTIQTDGSSRTLTRADLKHVGERVTYWQGKLTAAERRASGRGSMRYVVR